MYGVYIYTARGGRGGRVSSNKASMESGHEDVFSLERCPHFRGCYVQASVELGPEYVSLLERCPHFRGCYVQATMELGPKMFIQASMDMGCTCMYKMSIFTYSYATNSHNIVSPK